MSQPLNSKSKSKSADELASSIEQCPLPNRARRWLSQAGIRTVADLLRRTEDDLLVLANFSKTSLAHVKEFLRCQRLTLAPPRKLRCPTEWVRRALIEDGLSLTPRERQVLSMRHGLTPAQPRTLEAIGRALRVSRERIRQVQKVAELKVISYMIHQRGAEV